MNQDTYGKFRKLVFEVSGIDLGDKKQALVASRLSKRIRTLGLGGFEDYYTYVKKDSSGEELSNLINQISTNVTHFFREERHFQALSEVAGQWVKAGKNSINIWCAASSTGEEPYSILISLKEALAPGIRISLKASDISTRVLETARQGIYKQEDIENIPRNLLKSYFLAGGPRAKNLYRIKPELRSSVQFLQINLSTPPYPIQGDLDVIFCRNVMIYFDKDLRNILVNNFLNLLKPGGYLFVGMAESLSGMNPNLNLVEPSMYVKSG